MKKTFFAVIYLIASIAYCQEIKVDKIEPGNWWAGMKKHEIQLMVYGQNLSGFKASFNTSKIKIKKIHYLENQCYSFIDIQISPEIKPQTYKLSLVKDGRTAVTEFPLLKRMKSNNKFQGFNSEDVVYLIMPDRFADGDTANNIVKGIINDYRPDDPNGRHGGDLKGIIDHLRYFKELGITALWLNPVLENNTKVSYHGYAATDMYKVDPRLGTNALYKELVDKANSMGMKIIFDHVANHVSTNHPWIHNLPVKEWINGTVENHLPAWHDKMADWDIHSADLTKEYVTKGWFVDEMADLNQNNLYVKNYLIQNTIWWMEYAGIDGIREDTYPYVDQKFISVWAKEILDEYPHSNIVGEVWTGESLFLAPYQKGSQLNKNWNTNLPVVTDFALRDAYNEFLTGKSGLNSIYNTIAMDFVYQNPNDLLVFADNHDMGRAMYFADGNAEKVKLVFTHMLTSRGIPQILYGTEIGMVGNEDHGIIRTNFPGGMNDNSPDLFDAKNRNAAENDLFGFFRKMIELRKKYKSLSSGTLVHLPVREGVYIYSKVSGSEKIIIALNGASSKKEIDISAIENLGGKFSSLYDLMKETKREFVNGKIVLEPMSSNILLMKN